LFDRPNYAARWTDDQFQKLADMLSDGRPIPEIAKALGRSQEAVRNKAWQRGLLPPKTKKPRSSL
jgi:hypothetical protein